MKHLTVIQLKCLIQDTVNRDKATHDAAVEELRRRRVRIFNIMGDGPFQADKEKP